MQTEESFSAFRTYFALCRQQKTKALLARRMAQMPLRPVTGRADFPKKATMATVRRRFNRNGRAA